VFLKQIQPLILAFNVLSLLFNKTFQVVLVIQDLLEILLDRRDDAFVLLEPLLVSLVLFLQRLQTGTVFSDGFLGLLKVVFDLSQLLLSLTPRSLRLLDFEIFFHNFLVQVA